MKLVIRMLPGVLVFLPLLVLGANADLSYFDGLLTSISKIIDRLIPFMLALALLFFLWGVFQYFVLGGGDEEKQATGKKYMIYGLIGLVVMVAVWGIVQLIITVLGVGSSTTVSTPKVPK